MEVAFLDKIFHRQMEEWEFLNLCRRADRNVQHFHFLPRSSLSPLCRARSPRKPIQRCPPWTNLFHLCNDPMRSCLVSSTLQMRRLGTGMLGILSEDKQLTTYKSKAGTPTSVVQLGALTGHKLLLSASCLGNEQDFDISPKQYS